MHSLLQSRHRSGPRVHAQEPEVMNAVREILDLSIEPLTKGAAAIFGKALVFGGGVRPTSGGDWWRCWEGCAELSAGRQWAGFVRAQPSVPDIQEMEREP